MRVPIAASPHDWLEGRGPRRTLCVALDGCPLGRTTGQVLALLCRADDHSRFMVPAAEEGACYRVMAAGTDRDPRLCFKDQRTVGMDNTVRFGGERLPLLSGPHRR